MKNRSSSVLSEAVKTLFAHPAVLVIWTAGLTLLSVPYNLLGEAVNVWVTESLGIQPSYRGSVTSVLLFNLSILFALTGLSIYTSVSGPPRIRTQYSSDLCRVIVGQWLPLTLLATLCVGGTLGFFIGFQIGADKPDYPISFATFLLMGPFVVTEGLVVAGVLMHRYNTIVEVKESGFRAPEVGYQFVLMLLLLLSVVIDRMEPGHPSAYLLYLFSLCILSVASKSRLS